MSSTQPAAELDQAVIALRPRLGVGDVAWILALPCALLTLAGILKLGPSLAGLLPTPDPEKFWPGTPLAPEAVEHARFALAALGPVLLAVVVVLCGSLRIAPRRTWFTRSLIGVSHLALIGFLALCLLSQYGIVLVQPPVLPVNRLFDRPTLLTAAAVALLVPVAIRLRRSESANGVPDSRALRIACFVLAVLLTALWLSPAVNTEATAGIAWGGNLTSWDMSETFAVLDGRTPLVDFHSEYSHLIPFVAAVAMAPLGTSMGAWTVVMATLSGMGLLGLYGVFRRIVRRSLLALALYLPVMAFGFFVIDNGLYAEFHYTPAAIFSAWPMRYAGPYLLAWLTARHLDGATPRRTWLLFAAASLVAINNPEFGLGAFAGSVLAIVCSRPPSSVRAGARLAGEVAIGLLAATLLVSLLTLTRTGALPHFSYVLEFPHLYGVDGWYLEPMWPIGAHLAMYTTFGAAIAVAVVRTVRRTEEPVLTGMLAWSGVFGLGAGSYYLGRSDINNLVTLFSVWALVLALLVVAVVRNLATRDRPIPTLPELAALFGFGLAIAAVAAAPMPWSQVSRLREDSPPVFTQAKLKAAIAKRTHPGEKVAIFAPLGHRVAYDVGVENVVPYSMPEAMPTIDQVNRSIEAIRREHVSKVFLSSGSGPVGLAAGLEFDTMLQRAGFKPQRVP